MFVYSEDGNEQCLNIEEKGSLFGEFSAIDGLPHFASAIAIVDSEIYMVPKAHFLDIIYSSNDILEKVMKSIVRKNRVLSANITNLTLKNSYARVSTYLLKLAHSHGKIEGNHCRLQVKFTHQEMANLTGLNRVTVSNIIGDLLEKGILKKINGYINIEDIELLKFISCN